MTEGANPQEGKVTVDEFAAKIKEKYPAYKDVDNLKLAQAVVEKYPEYKEAVIFEPTEPVKKKDGNIPSASLDGESPSFLSEVNTFFQPTYDVADWVNKNIPVWSAWASISTQLAGGMTKAVDATVKESILNFMPDSEYKESIKKKIQEEGIDKAIDTPLEDIAVNMSQYGEEIKRGRLGSYGVSEEEQQLGIIGNITSGNLKAAATLALDGTVEGIIQSGLAALTGVAPLAIAAGGEKYYDVSNKPNYSSSERILYSSAVGLMEGLIESVFASDIKAFGKVLDSEIAIKGFEKELLAAAKNTPWYKEFLKMGTEEGLEESLSESFGQMLTGFKEGTRPDPIAIAEAFVMGFLPGAGTHVITNGISAIGSEQRTKRRQQLAKRIEETKAKVEEIEDPAQKAILEEMAKDDIDELNKEIGLDAELYAGFSEEDVNEIQSINTEIRNLYQKIGLAADEDQKNAYKKRILDARSRKLEIENRYSEKPVRYIRDGRLVTKAQFVDMVNNATPEELSTGQWGVENDSEVEQLLISKLPQEAVEEAAAEGAPAADVTQEETAVEEPAAEEITTEEVAAEEVATEEVVAEDVVEEPTQEVDTEAIAIEEEIISDAEFRIEDLESEISIEKGNIKEAKAKAKEDTAAVRKSKLSKEEKAERIEEIKAELQDTIDEINGNIGIYKEDINAFKSDIRKANKKIEKLKTPKVTAKKKPAAVKATPSPTKPAPKKPETKQKTETVLAKSDVSSRKFGSSFKALKDNFQKLLSKLGGENIPVYVVSDDVYKSVTGKTGRGTFTKIDGKDVILVNADKATLGTVYHEMMHAYVATMNLSPRQIVDFVNTIRAELAKGNASERALAKRLTDFQNQYIEQEIYGKGKTLDDPIIAEEFLSEFVAQLKDGIDVDNISVSTIENIRLAIARFINKVFNARIDTSPIENRQEAFDFVNGFLDALEGRVTVEPSINKTASPNQAQRSRLQIEELDIILLDEQGGEKELSSMGGSDPRNIQIGKMTVVFGKDGLTFKTDSDTGRMKRKGGEMFVPYSRIETMPGINKFEKGTKEYAYYVAGMESIADPYRGDPVKLLESRLIKPEDLGKKGTRTEGRFSEEDGKRIASMISNFNKLSKKFGRTPPKIVFGNSLDIKQYYRYLTGEEKRSTTQGTYSILFDTIFINTSSADIATVAHELTHAYIRAVKLDQKKIVEFANILESELAKGTANEVKLGKELGRFRDGYVNRKTYGEKAKDDAIIAEEFLAEYVGRVFKFSENLSPSNQISFIEKVRTAVVKFLAKLGVVDKNLVAKIKTREEALNFINGFVGALQGRAGVTADTNVEEQGESGEVGTINIPRQQIEVINAPKLSEDKRSFVQKFVTEIKMTALQGRKFVTNMYDYTNAGVTDLGNGLSITLFGGRNYVPMMMERNGVELGDVSNLAAFNSKEQAEGFIRNATKGKADLFGPHSGGLEGSWQFQHHIFESLVNLVLDNKILSKSELIELFNTGLNTKGVAGGIKAFAKFNERNKTKLKNLNRFKKNPLELVELLNAENNYSPNLRKILNQKIASNKKFQKAIGVKNLNEFHNRISDPLNTGVSGGEIMTFVEFDPSTFKVVKTKPGDVNHHPSFGWVVMAKIKAIHHPDKYYKSYDITDSYTKHNVDGTVVEKKSEVTEKQFIESNVKSSAGAIAKIAEVDVAREQIDWESSEFGRGQVNPAIVNRTTEVQQAVIELLQGMITNSEYQETVRITQPIEAITRFFLPASTKDMMAALDSNKGKLLNVTLKDGTEIGLRLDIPAYKNKNIWVVSIHDKGASGKSLSYGSVAWATDVKFGSNPKVASFIAAGKNMDTLKKQDKTTIARMLGKWKNFEGKTKEEKDASAVKKVEEIVAIESSYPGAGRKGSPWRQIGMNPFRHSFFYDRRNGQPVIAAAEVVQIGGLVYAKDVVYADKNDPIFNVDGYKDANGETVRFQIEDQANEEANNEQTYDAVENNSQGLFDADVDAAVDADVSEMDSWKERPRTMFERFIDLTRLKIQDKFRKIIAVQEDIEFSKGAPVGLDEDFRNAEALMHGKAKEELNKTEIIVGKIAKLIKASGLSIEKFNDLLYAMHAQERNRYLRVISTDIGKSLMAMRKKKGMKPSEVAELLGISTQDYVDIEANKTALKTSDLADVLLIYGTTPSRFFYDNAKVKDGSGMTDVEARKILAEYGLDLASPDVSQLKPRIAIAVQAVRDLTADTRNRLLESGLETQATIDAFTATYKNYVPLRGFADGELQSEMIEGGRRLEVRGREKRAKGRATKADSPLTQVIISNTTTIVRAEKNSVMNRFYNLAVSNPNKDVYEIVDPKVNKEYKREIRNGKIITTAKTIADYMSDPNMVSVRVGGEYKFIRFKDASLADALKGANIVKADWMVKYLGAFNRVLSSFITTYDPSFVFRNFFRDIQTAVINLYAEQEMTEGLIKDKSIVDKVVKDVFPAIRSIAIVEGGKSSKNKEMDQYYREFKEDGAKTEWFYSKSSKEVEKDIKNLIEGKGETAIQAAGNIVERINSAVENGVRLSTYVNARKAGVSRAKSAELAKELTVNFNKSGEWGQIGNTLFLFFNASVQGTSRLMRTLKPQYKVDSEGNRSLHITRAQKMTIGLSLMGSILSVLNELGSDDDEDDKSFYSKIPDFEKERNIIIMKPDGKTYWKLPLPYGLNVFYVTGTLLADAAQKIKTPGEVAGGIMQAVLGSFSPINFPNSDDTSKFLMKFVTPTIGQVPLGLAINENYFGQTIYNENFPFDTSPKPESELGRKGANRWTKELTRLLNKISGGSEFRSGNIDINPDKIDFVMESYSGGMGKFLSRSANTIDKIITGNWDQIEPRQVPFLRIFYGQSPKYANVQEFYTRSILVNQMQEEVKAGIISGAEAKRVSKVFYLGKNIRKQLSALKKREDVVMQIKDADVQKEKMKKLEELRYKLVADYNKQYERFEIDKLK